MTGGNDSAPGGDALHRSNHSATTSAAPQPDTDKRMTIYVKDQSGTQIEFRIKSTTKFEKVFMAFEKAQGRQGLRFHFDGERVNADQTPGDVEMEDGDILEAFAEQLGVGWKDERRCRAMD
ncbi:hypothetical protein H2203_009169 [Taxawa tesnikishii (nom. ined.)]|nr:hypothetical protein H2203_009169 [Dothideales sp. JES 119]